jgi:sulfate-transporting ATPase
VTDLFWPGKHELPPTALAAVREFELEPHLDETPEELPYGRRRLVGIARAVASGPSIVLLDEPAAGLDENESADLARLIRRLADERKMGVLFITHDMGVVADTCDEVLVMNGGRVVESVCLAE